MTELDRAVLEERDRYREAYDRWERVKNLPDPEERVDATEKLMDCERMLLSIARRHR